MSAFLRPVKKVGMSYCPLHALVALEIVCEAELVFLIGEFEKVEEFGGRLHDGKGWVLSVVYENRYAA